MRRQAIYMEHHVPKDECMGLASAEAMREDSDRCRIPLSLQMKLFSASCTTEGVRKGSKKATTETTEQKGMPTLNSTRRPASKKKATA